MKKIMIMAATALMALTAGAQTAKDLSAKVDEAFKVINAEKENYAKYSAKIMPNYNPAVYYDACVQAINAAIACEEVDKQPNEKGKIAPKFRKKNVTRINPLRADLVGAGLDAYNDKDYAAASKYFGAYSDSRQTSLFEGSNIPVEPNYGQITYYGALAAFFAKDYAPAIKRAQIALASNDQELESFKTDAVNIQVSSYEEMQKAGGISKDELIANVKAISEKYPDNPAVFSRLVTIYQENGDDASANQAIDARLQKDPNDYMANALLGQNAQNASDFEKAIDSYKRVMTSKPDFIQVKQNLAFCYFSKAAAAIEKNSDNLGRIAADALPGITEDMNQAKKILDEVKVEDPDENQVSWKFLSNRIDYVLENLK